MYWCLSCLHTRMLGGAWQGGRGKYTYYHLHLGNSWNFEFRVLRSLRRLFKSFHTATKGKGKGRTCAACPPCCCYARTIVAGLSVSKQIKEHASMSSPASSSVITPFNGNRVCNAGGSRPERGDRFIALCGMQAWPVLIFLQCWVSDRWIDFQKDCQRHTRAAH